MERKRECTLEETGATTSSVHGRYKVLTASFSRHLDAGHTRAAREFYAHLVTTKLNSYDTDNISPRMGELFDHGVDACNTALEVLLFAGANNMGQSWETVAMLFCCTFSERKIAGIRIACLEIHFQLTKSGSPTHLLRADLG